MNINSMPIFNVAYDATENMINYFFNHYTGDQIPQIGKGKFLINFFISGKTSDNLLLSIEQTDISTSISLIENSKVETTISFDELDFKINLEYNDYSISSQKEINVFSNVELPEEYILETIQWYIITTYFISSFLDKLDYKVTVNNSKKKRKHKRKEYIIDRKFVDEFTKLNFEDNIEHSSLESFNHIKTSVKNIDSFKEYLKDIKIEKFIYLPFEEFVIDCDRNITQIYCKFNSNKNSLECIVFKTKCKVFAMDINLNNGRYKTYTFYDFFTFKQEDYLDISELKANIVNIIQYTLNFMAFFKVKKTIVKRNDSIKNTDEKHSYNVSGDDTVYINTQKVYEIDISSVIKNPILRKAPVYVKPKWDRRGHVRHLKSGKQVYINPTTCNRKKFKNKIEENKIEENTSVKKYIIS